LAEVRAPTLLIVGGHDYLVVDLNRRAPGNTTAGSGYLSDWTRQASKKGNRWARRIAGTRLGMLYFDLGALHHVGRRSGREYVTPLSAYPLGDGFVLSVAYPKVDWSENVLAAGKCTLTWNGKEYALERPELIPAAEAMKAYPLLVKPFLAAQAPETDLVESHRRRPKSSVPWSLRPAGGLGAHR